MYVCTPACEVVNEFWPATLLRNFLDLVELPPEKVTVLSSAKFSQEKCTPSFCILDWLADHHWSMKVRIVSCTNFQSMGESTAP